MYQAEHSQDLRRKVLISPISILTLDRAPLHSHLNSLSCQSHQSSAATASQPSPAMCLQIIPRRYLCMHSDEVTHYLRHRGLCKDDTAIRDEAARNGKLPDEASSDGSSESSTPAPEEYYVIEKVDELCRECAKQEKNMMRHEDMLNQKRGRWDINQPVTPRRRRRG